ncbi:retinal-binding protein-like isoform X2 [Ruditapes philippinarum]|uniref:retinal-binding protein-like isoform X2 n=1 Tax=Ruditapes philippinarum TaxID=129788 RepID=UPI00295B265C|nr:retinal-binding protein-like isoform X2 [Ruditapes philippinarum]
MPKNNNKKEEKEQAKVNELRARLSDILKSDYEDFYLRKWLKARGFDINKAEQMFRNSVAYKTKMKVETLMAEFETPEVIKNYLTGGFCGHDKEGSPIRVELYGHLDLKGIMASVKKSDLEKTKILQCEHTVLDWERQSKKLGKRVDGLTVIFDMEGVTTKMMWRPGLQMYLHLVKILEDNYPEMLKRMFVINAPLIFPVLYKLARPLISDEMRNKIHVLGATYTDTLLQYIDADQLPAFLGGTLTDPDGNKRCVTMINQGGEVPEKYFLDIKELYEHMKTATITRGDKLELEYQIDKPDSILRWEFKTEDYDIGFGVNFRKNGVTSVILPMKRVNSQHVAEDGSITCKETGTYLLYFDNSFSWTRSKNIYYIGEVIEVDDEYVRSEINDLVEMGDWKTLEEKFETTHL